MNQNLNHILWMEDLLETVGAELEWLEKNKTLKIHTFSTLTMLKNHLNKWEKDSAQFHIAAIILDVQLFGVTDLSPFFDEEYISFLPNESGWMIAEHILRAEGSKYLDIPLLIYTVQDLNNDINRQEGLRKNGGKELGFIEKKSGSDSDPKFIEWINKNIRTR